MTAAGMIKTAKERQPKRSAYNSFRFYTSPKQVGVNTQFMVIYTYVSRHVCKHVVYKEKQRNDTAFRAHCGQGRV